MQFERRLLQIALLIGLILVSGAHAADTPSCGENCCGNQSCESTIGEDFGTCPADCTTPKKVTVHIQSPADQSQFSRGDTVLIAATIDADSLQKTTANQIIAVGKFGTIDLFDDGTHSDEHAGDHVYTNSFVIDEQFKQQSYTVAVTATVSQTTNSATTSFEVYPFLVVSFGTDKETYSLGDEIQLTGIVNRKGLPLSIDVNVEIGFEDEILYFATVKSNLLGQFDLKYQTTTIHPAGEWTIKLHVRDDSQNYGYYEKKIETVKASAFSSMEINYLTPTTEPVQTGEQIIVEAEVLDRLGQKVSGAEVLLVPPGANRPEAFLTETIGKTYQLLYQVPFDLNIGQQRFELRATKRTPEGTQSAAYPFILKIEKSRLNMLLIEPMEVQYAIGDQMPVKVRVIYTDNQPVENAIVSASFNNTPIALEKIEKGVYLGRHSVTEIEKGKNRLVITAKDEFDNTGETNSEIFVNGYAPGYFITQNAGLLAFVGLIAFVFAVVAVRRLKKTKTAKAYSDQKELLQKMLEDLQKRYYKEKTISRETYDHDRQEIENLIEQLDRKLKETARKNGEKK